MLDFSSKTPAAAARNSSAVRIASLVLMLGIAVALITSLRRPPLPGSSSPSPSPPTVVSELPTIPKGPASIDLQKLSGQIDHSRAINHDAYYYLLDQASKTSAEWMNSHVKQDVPYAGLLDEPDRFRGQPIRLRGRLHRLNEYRALPNEFGIHHIYEGWIFTQASGSLPYVAILAAPPQGIPQGNEIFVPVEGDGFFLGWWRYTTDKGKRTSAPMVMMSELRRLEEVTPLPTAVPGWLGPLAGAALFLGLGASLWGAWRHAQAPTASVGSPEPWTWEEQTNDETNLNEDGDRR